MQRTPCTLLLILGVVLILGWSRLDEARADDLPPPPTCEERAAEIVTLVQPLVSIESMIETARVACGAEHDDLMAAATAFSAALDGYYSDPPTFTQAQLDAAGAAFEAAEDELEAAYAQASALVYAFEIMSAGRDAALDAYELSCP